MKRKLILFLVVFALTLGTATTVVFAQQPSPPAYIGDSEIGDDRYYIFSKTLDQKKYSYTIDEDISIRNSTMGGTGTITLTYDGLTSVSTTYTNNTTSKDGAYAYVNNGIYYCFVWDTRSCFEGGISAQVMYAKADVAWTFKDSVLNIHKIVRGYQYLHNTKGGSTDSGSDIDVNPNCDNVDFFYIDIRYSK